MSTLLNSNRSRNVNLVPDVQGYLPVSPQKQAFNPSLSERIRTFEFKQFGGELMVKENMSPNKSPQQSTLDVGHDPKPSHNNGIGNLKAFHGNEDKKAQKKKLFDLSIFGISEERWNVELKVGKRSKDLHVSESSTKVEDLGHSNAGQENWSQSRIGQERSIQLRISQENLDKLRINQVDLSNSRIDQVDLSNSRINKDYADQSTIDQENLDQSRMGREDCDRSRIGKEHSDDLRDGQDDLSKQPDVDEPRILQEHLVQSRISQELSGKSRKSQEYSGQSRSSQEDFNHSRASQEDFNHSRIGQKGLGHSRTGSEQSGQSRVAPGDLDQSSFSQEDLNHSRADQEHFGHSMVGQDELSHSRTELEDLGQSKNGEHDFGRSRIDQEIMPYEEPKGSVVTVDFSQNNDGKDVRNEKASSDGHIGCRKAPKKLFDLSIFGIPEGKLNLELKGRKESKALDASQNMRKVNDFQLSESDRETVSEVPEFSFFGVGEDCNKEEMLASVSSTSETLHQVLKDGVVMNSFIEPDMAFSKHVGEDCNKQYTSEMSESSSSTAETLHQVLLKDGVVMNAFIEPDMAFLKHVGEDSTKQYTSEMSASVSSTADTLRQVLKDGVVIKSFIEPDMAFLKDALYGSTSHEDPSAEISANEDTFIGDWHCQEVSEMEVAKNSVAKLTSNGKEVNYSNEISANEDTSIGDWHCQEVSEMEVAKDSVTKLTSNGKEISYSNVNMEDWTQDQIKIDSSFLYNHDELLQQSPPRHHYYHAEMQQKSGPRSVRTMKTRTRSARFKITESSRIQSSDVEVERKESLRILTTETWRVRTSNAAESKHMEEEAQSNAKIKSTTESRSLPSNAKVKLVESSRIHAASKPKVKEVKDTESRTIIIGNDTFKHEDQKYALRVYQKPELSLHTSPRQMPTLDTRERIDQWLSSAVEVKTKFEHWHSQESLGQARLVSAPLSLSLHHDHVHCTCIRCARDLHHVHLHIEKALSIPFSTEAHKEPPPKLHQTYAYKASTRKNVCPPFPGIGSAPFVICKHCLQILQVPQYLPPKSHGSIQRLQCGACTRVSKFYVVTS